VLPQDIGAFSILALDLCAHKATETNQSVLPADPRTLLHDLTSYRSLIGISAPGATPSQSSSSGSLWPSEPGAFDRLSL
jgi:hypothetical protein